MSPGDDVVRSGGEFLNDGDIVRVFNDRGACLAGVRLNEGVREGVLVVEEHAAHHHSLAVARGAGALTARDALRMATRDGARAISRLRSRGSVTTRMT